MASPRPLNIRTAILIWGIIFPLHSIFMRNFKTFSGTIFIFLFSARNGFKRISAYFANFLNSLFLGMDYVIWFCNRSFNITQASAFISTAPRAKLIIALNARYISHKLFSTDCATTFYLVWICHPFAFWYAFILAILRTIFSPSPFRSGLSYGKFLSAFLTISRHSPSFSLIFSLTLP